MLYARSEAPTKAENKKVGGRQYRRSYNWERRNRPKFGPLNVTHAEPQQIVVNRTKLMYG